MYYLLSSAGYTSCSIVSNRIDAQNAHCHCNHHTIIKHDWKDKIHIYKDSGYDCRYRAHSEQSRLDKHPEHILSGLSKTRPPSRH